MDVEADLKRTMDPARQAEERAFAVRLAKVAIGAVLVAVIGHLLVDISLAGDYVAAATTLSFLDFVQELCEESRATALVYQAACYGGAVVGAIIGLITTRR